MTKGIIYYTDNRLASPLADIVRTQLQTVGLPIVSVSLAPLPGFGTNVHLPLERGYVAYFQQILTALETSKADVVFFCEHDVLYPLSHFAFTPEETNTFYYNINVWKVRATDGFAVKTDDCKQVSGICVDRMTAVTHYQERNAYVHEHGYQWNMGFEPFTHKRISWPTRYRAGSWKSPDPLVDVRHEGNLSHSRWSPAEFRNQCYTRGWTEGTCPEWATPLLSPLFERVPHDNPSASL